MIRTALKKRVTSSPVVGSKGCSGENQKHSAIRNYLLGRVLSGQLPPGAKVPSEYTLAKRFSANKTTCNKAVSMLASEGYLTRRRGAGTFVSDSSIRQQRPCIGVLMKLRAGSFFSNLLVGIQEKAFDRGYGVQFFNPPEGGDDPDKFRHFLETAGVKGMVISRPFHRSFAGMQNLYLNTSVPHPGVSQVQTDDSKLDIFWENTF
jgi:DNA-binding LacI/PurR family transcriptional regulator